MLKYTSLNDLKINKKDKSTNGNTSFVLFLMASRACNSATFMAVYLELSLIYPEWTEMELWVIECRYAVFLNRILSCHGVKERRGWMQHKLKAVCVRGERTSCSFLTALQRRLFVSLSWVPVFIPSLSLCKIIQFLLWMPSLLSAVTRLFMRSPCLTDNVDYRERSGMNGGRCKRWRRGGRDGEIIKNDLQRVCV